PPRRLYLQPEPLPPGPCHESRGCRPILEESAGSGQRKVACVRTDGVGRRGWGCRTGSGSPEEPEGDAARQAPSGEGPGSTRPAGRSAEKRQPAPAKIEECLCSLIEKPVWILAQPTSA